MMTAKGVIDYMESLRDDEQRRVLMRFFKTGPGEYGEGDQFLGLKVPRTREVVRAVARDFSVEDVPVLLMSKWHEVRLCGLLILVGKFERLCTKKLMTDAEASRKRAEILKMYLEYAECANNWDLVDLSASKILGGWLVAPFLSPYSWPLDDSHHYLMEKRVNRSYRSAYSPEEELAIKQHVLDELAQSNNLWRQRMSMVCTWKTSHEGDPTWCLRYAEKLLHHPHDLMHKAVGWMLREMGKHCSMDLLREFLRQHVHDMPRTTLRYAIEKMSDLERQEWMRIPVG